MLREFDALYAISDLHLGGSPGRRAFRETAALAWLIHQVTNSSHQHAALLLNGDVVDFLADDAALEFNPNADQVLRGMKDDADFKPIFEALAKLVAKTGRWLVVQLGNHDIELALPAAQAAFRDLIGAASGPAAERVLFETSGRGWTCAVGPRLVLAVHGNAADPWNEVDHKGLEAARDALARGRQPVPQPVANAGTTLVVHVMNAVKREFPFVDLLKPEDAPLMAVLEAVNADASTRGLLKALGRRATKGQWGELLGVSDNDAAAVPTGTAQAQMLDFLKTIEVPRVSPQDALLRAERHLSARTSVRSLVVDDRGQLGALRDRGRVALQQLEGAIGRLRGVPERESLRRALVGWLARDTSFDVGRLSTIDMRILDQAPGSVDLVLAGHTHLAREQFGAPAYINTGTWMRVLSLNNSAYLQDEAQFSRFFDAVKQPDLAALDALNIDPRLRPVAIITRDAAQLHSVREDKGGHSLKRVSELPR